MTASHRRLARLVGIAGTVLLVAIGLMSPRTAAAGGLIAFAMVGAPVLGAAALLFIHRLTGGRWGELARPALTVAASVTPLILVFFVLLLIGAASVYPWVLSRQAAGPGVAELYLNLPFYAARGIVVLAGLSLFAVLAVRGRLDRLRAGLALVFYGVGMDLAAVDWLLSVEPRYTSSAFGAQIIVAQLIAGIDVALLATPASRDKAWGDLGSLLLATTLGESYLILMTFIVHWYGDLPEQAAFYLARSENGWAVLEIVGVLVGAAGPMVALLFSGIRHAASALKIVAGASLAGLALEFVWLVAPVTGGWSGLAGAVAIIAAGGLVLGFAESLRGATGERVRHGV